MARHRVNTAFILKLGIGIVVVIAVLGGLYWYKFVYSKNPLPLVEAGDKAMAEGAYEKAIEAYASAIKLNDNDPMVWVKLGDAHNYLAAEDMQNLLKARSVWEAVITANPRLLPAHQRMLKFCREFAEAAPGASRVQWLDRAAETAKAILRINPQDKEAQFVVHQAAIDGWLAGAPTPPERISESISELRKLQQEQPENYEIPFAIARALAQQGFQAVQRGDRNEATMLFDEATKVMADAVAARPDDPHLLLRQAQLIVGIGPRLEQQIDRNEALIREKSRQVAQEASVLLDKALKLMNPDHEDYVPCAQYAALMRQRLDKVDEAETILREALARRPDEMVLRVQLADQIRTQPGRLEEALQFLSEAPPPGPARPGVAGQLARDAERRGILLLSEMKLDLYWTLRDQDPTRAAQLLKEAEEGHAKLASREADAPRVLKLKGKLELFRGNGVGAVQTLNRALTQVGTDPNDRTAFEIKYLLARAYQLTGQSGESEKLMREIVERLDYFPAQVELTRLLLQRGDTDGALKQLQSLNLKQPNSQEVISLWLAYEDIVSREQDPTKFKELFASLQERTPAEKMYKARIAYAGQLYAEAVALLEQVYKERPDDRTAVALLARSYQKNRQTDVAIRTLEDFIQRHPDSPGLRVVLEELRGKTGAELDATRREDILKIPDPVLRNLSLHEFYRRRNDEEGMAAALAELVKLAPEDQRVIDVRYQTALVKRDWSTAEKLIEHITRNNLDNAGGKLARARLALARAQAETNPETRKLLEQAAIDSAADLVAARGDFAEAWIALALAQQHAGKLEDAVNSYNQALNRQFQNQAALEGLIRCTYLLRRKDDCRRYIDQARKVYPKSQLFIEYEVSWEAQFGDPKKIIPIRERNLAENPDSPLSYGNLAAAWEAAARREAANPEEVRRMREKSREIFGQGVAKFPTDLNLVSAYGELCHATGRWEDGLKAWKRLLEDEEFKDSTEAATRVVGFFRRGGKFDEGIAYLTDFLSRKEVPSLRVALGDLYLAKNDREQAMKHFEAAGVFDAAIKRRTELLMGEGKMKEALAVAESAVNAQPDNPGLQCRLAFIHMTMKQEEAARNALNKVLSANPRDPEALFYLALLETQAQNPDRALMHLAGVFEVVPDSPDALKLRAEIYRRRNNFVGAAADMEAVLRKVPDDKSTRIQLIEMYINMDPPRLVDAERLCREAASIPQLARDYDILHAEARVFYAKGEFQQALQRVMAAIQVAPDNLALQDTYFRTLMAMKDYNAVIKAATSLLSREKEPWIYATRAAAHCRLKQTEQALADFEAGYNLATERSDGLGQQTIIRGMQEELDIKAAIGFLAPRVGDDMNRQILLAQLYAQAGEFSQAAEVAKRIYQQRDKMSRVQRSAFLKFFGSTLLQPPPDVTLARQVYDEYLQMVPNDFEALNNIGYALLLPGSGATPQEALSYTQRAYDQMVRLNTIDPFVEDTHGQALMEAGQLQEAINVLRDAASRKEFPEVYINLADALQRNGDFQDATMALDRAQQLIEESIRRQLRVNPDLDEKITALRKKISEGG
ncbi:MAG: tetratricopeptide repeat protein, partial [Phycisphaerae bacterium]|nr:tetratricopeptide repeat protein [Phycisphaerae bacterium]